jgi:hypothetical protein
VVYLSINVVDLMISWIGSEVADGWLNETFYSSKVDNNSTAVTNPDTAAVNPSIPKTNPDGSEFIEL